MTQGHTVTQESLLDFVTLLRLPEEDKERLKNLTPEDYIGIAPKLVSIV
jgi:adenylosuccinate lyase